MRNEDRGGCVRRDRESMCLSVISTIESESKSSFYDNKFNGVFQQIFGY